MKGSVILLVIVTVLTVGCTLTPTVPERPTPRIAFMTDRDGNFEIYIMEADGSDQKPLVTMDGQSFTPHWSNSTE